MDAGDKICQIEISSAGNPLFPEGAVADRLQVLSFAICLRPFDGTVFLKVSDFKPRVSVVRIAGPKFRWEAGELPIAVNCSVAA